MNGTIGPKTKYQTVSVNEDNLRDEQSNTKFRFVNKNGRININYSSLGGVKYMPSNIVLFIMQAKWWLVLTIVLLGFIISWFFFALLYFLVSIEHGDFFLNEDEEVSNNTTNYTRQYSKIDREKCVQDVHNFLSALLFSIETQHTIGYGSRYITTECMGGILVLTLQCSLGYLLQVIVTQIVFTKLSRPTEKSQFLVFSDSALIAPSNNRLTLTFRIGNLSASQLIFASARLLMIRQRQTLEGEIIPHQIFDMEITHVRNGQLFFPRPNVVEHIINSRSPLFGIQRSTLGKEHFEIIAIIEGSFEYTGFPCHFRTSYLPDELLWGYQFSSCNSTLSGYDYEQFNHIQLIDARPLWNYEEGEESNSPTTPLSSPSFSHKHFIKVNHRANLQRQDSFDETVPVNNRFPIIGTMESVRNNSFKNMPSMNIAEEQDEVDKLPSDSFIKKVEFE